ncbi:hypothetical protein MHM98_12575 [Psychrobium sp. MM17-31]|uniref:hypothetical protein n=1 Tax=Psychrobium sp. MM17-31 TaxID=2917758 RepID=UPI001EF50F1D|nr:hypothetical protein [Psychrobium sp. MM17-31]MCG7532166.1 hypothetical protein [Psychrobium sp. MM17-31]
MKLSFLPVAVLSLLVFSFDAFGCSCSRNVDAKKLYSQSDKIVIGKVVKLQLFTDERGVEYQEVTLSNSEVIKGSLPNVFNAYLNGSSCSGNSFSIGREHIVFLYSDDWTTGYCGGTSQIHSYIEVQNQLIDSLRKEAAKE